MRKVGRPGVPGAGLQDTAHRPPTHPRTVWVDRLGSFGSNEPRPGWKTGDSPSQALDWAVEALTKAGTRSIIGVHPPTMKDFPIGATTNSQSLGSARRASSFLQRI